MVLPWPGNFGATGIIIKHPFSRLATVYVMHRDTPPHWQLFHSSPGPMRAPVAPWVPSNRRNAGGSKSTRHMHACNATQLPAGFTVAGWLLFDPESRGPVGQRRRFKEALMALSIRRSILSRPAGGTVHARARRRTARRRLNAGLGTRHARGKETRKSKKPGSEPARPRQHTARQRDQIPDAFAQSLR